MATGVVVTALGVVLARKPVQSVLALLASFLCLSVIYLVAGFQFLAAIQILLYGGAVMVLFLFVVMLLNLGDPQTGAGSSERMFHGDRRTMIGLGVAIAIAAVGLTTLLRAATTNQPAALREARIVVPEEGFDPVLGLAGEMFTRYALPFEAASVLLLAAAVGVLVIAKRERRAAPARPDEREELS